MSVQMLAQQACAALIAQEPVEIRHEPGWVREGFPLPMKRVAPDASGVVVQQYRPLAVLEYVHEVLSGELAARRAKIRAAAKEAAHG